MGNGIGAVTPGDMQDIRGEYSLSSLLKTTITTGNTDETKMSTCKKLLRAAVNYLREAGIEIPYATLEVRGKEVVMHGVPHGGEILVCALEGSGIQNYL